MREAKRKSVAMSNIAMGVCGMVMVICLAILGYYIYQYAHGQKEYRTLEKTVIQQQNEIFLVDFKSLQERNTDTVGWIRTESGDISYPIVQTTDNDFYLKHGFDKETLRSGCIFMDYQNAPDLSDAITYIYGHNMKDKSMFAKLNEYKNISYYKENPEFMIYTPEGTYHYEVFSSFDMNVEGVTVPISFDSQTSQQDYLNGLVEKSDIKTDRVLSPEDRIVALMTCNGVETSRRVTYGVLVKEE